MNENELKIGTKIVATRLCNGTSNIGKILEIVKTHTGYYDVKLFNAQNNLTFAVYCGYDGRQDDYTIATRKQIADELKESIKARIEEVNRIKGEIEYYEKYESDEEYLAGKIDQLMNTKGITAKAEILRELRRSNYL